MRIILHLDLDSFYAAVEERRNPSLKGKPVVVCMFSGRTEDSGAVATANYEARKLGIRSGMPILFAKSRASKETVFLPADREHYKQVSDRIMDILRNHANAFEQRSIDEAYLDISACGTFPKAQEIAQKIKNNIQRKEGLTCSVGIGPNKLIAKMASREQKPDGLTVVKEEDIKKFLSEKPVEKFFGIGPKTLKALKKHSIQTIRDLASVDAEILRKECGERKGALLHAHAQGKDDEEVAELVKKQLSRIGTLKKDTRDFTEIAQKLDSLTDDLGKKIRREGIQFRTISLIAITSSLDAKTRSTTLESASAKREDIRDAVHSLLREFLEENRDVLRRVGVRVSSFSETQQGYKKEPHSQRSLNDFQKAR